MQRLCSLPLQGSQDLSDSLVSHLQGKVASTHTAGKCSATAQEKEDAAQVVQRLSNDKSAGSKVLVVCGDVAGSLEDEMKSVVAFSKALSAAFGSHVTAYMSDTASQVCHTWSVRSWSFRKGKLTCAYAVRLIALFVCIKLVTL